MKPNSLKAGSALHDGKTQSYSGTMERVETRAGLQPKVKGYEILEKLGEGGMGTVWLAIQQGTKREVALKLMSDAMFYSDRARARFEREVELAARLEHPNIARIYESGLEAGILYYAMELVENTQLAEYIRENHLSNRGTMEMMMKVCKAVGYAHRRGVIHRDLKPSNILVDSKGEPKILDFGLAKSLLEKDRDNHVSATGEVFGTPAYMSPEQAAGRPNKVDTRSDVYSLGAILYDLLGGHPPHDVEGSYYDRMRAIVEHEPVRLRTVNPKTDLDTEAIVYKALAKDQDTRYDNAEAMANDIRRYLNKEMISARKPTMLYVLGKQIRKHQLVITFILLGIVAIIIAVASYVHGIQNEHLKTIEAAQKALVAKAQANERAVAHRNALYGHRIALAHRELLDGGLTRTDEVLDLCPPDMRHFEWYFLRNLNQRRPLFLSGHESNVKVSALHPTDPLAATGDVKGRIKVWDITKGVVLFTLKGHRREIVKLVFSQDGRLLLSVDRDGTVNAWDLQNETKRIVLKSNRESAGRSTAFSPDGKWIATANNSFKTLRLWSFETGEKKHEVNLINETVEELPSSAESKSIIRVEKSIIRDLAFTPDSKTLVTVGYNDRNEGQLKLWRVDDFKDGVVLKDSVYAKGIRALDISQDGKWIVTGEQHIVRIWDLEKERQVGGGYKLFGGPVDSVRFDPTGQRFIAAGVGTVRIYDWRQSVTVLTLRPEGLESTSGCDRAGRYFITQGGTPVPQLWSLPASERVERFDRLTDTFMTSPDGTRILHKNYSNEVEIINVKTKEYVAKLKDDHIQHLINMSISPDSRWLATYAWDHNVVLWDLKTGEKHKTLASHKNLIQATAFSQLGDQFVSAGVDRTLRIWDVAGGEEVALIANAITDVKAIAVQTEFQQVAAVGPDQKVRIWHVASGDLVSTLPVQSSPITTLAFSPHQQVLASGGLDHLIRLWDVENGELIKTLTGHEQPIVKLNFSDDGQRLFSVASDKTVRIWNPSSGREILELPNDLVAADDFIINTDGTSIAVTSSNTIRFWRAPRPDFPQGHTIKVLDHVDLEQDVYMGEAFRKPTGLVTSSNLVTKVVLPVRLDQDYEFTSTIVPNGTHQPLLFVLPVGRRFLPLMLNGPEEQEPPAPGILGLANEQENKPQFKHLAFKKRETYALSLKVNIEGMYAKITGTINDEEMIDWEGLVSSLPHHAHADTPTREGGLSLVSQHCSYELRDVQIKVGKGGAWLLR